LTLIILAEDEGSKELGDIRQTKTGQYLKKRMEEYFDQECLSIFSAGGLTQPQKINSNHLS